MDERGANAIDAARERPEESLLSGAGRVGLFLRAAVPDAVLVLIASVALVFTVSYGFESAPELRSNVLACTGFVVPLVILLFMSSWSKRAIVASAALSVAYAAAVLVVLGSQLPPDVPLVADGRVNDVAENPVVFGVVAIVVPVVVYVLSRRRVGVVVLFAVAAIACGAIQFLYRDWSTAQPGTLAAFVAMFACGMLFVYQGYRSSVYGAKRITKTSFGGAAAFSLLIAALCITGASAFYYGVIEPLGLPTPEVKPFEDYYQKPVEEFRSIYEEQEIENPDVLTNMTSDEVDETNQDAEGGSQGQTAEEQEDWSGSPLSALIRNALSFDSDSWDEAFTAINFEMLAWGAAIFMLALVVAVAAAVLLRRSMRERRLNKLRGQPPAYGVWYLYTFLTERLERLGFVRPETFTPLEFAMASRNAMAPFTQGTDGVDYLQLTLIYQRACYAPETLSASDERDIVRYYREFFKNARKFVGARRWLWKFWRI